MKLVESLRRLLRRSPAAVGSERSERPLSEATIRRRVLLIIHNPVIPQQGGYKLHQALNWNDPDQLAAGYIDDVRLASGGYVNYEIVVRREVDGFPAKADGFAYTAEQYIDAWQRQRGFHEPDRVNYERLLRQFDVYRQVDQDQIDEVWLMGFPYAGYYESLMVGPGAFWCNAPPLAGGPCRRRFVVMGFNYQRGVGEMLENLGHRVESIMSHVYRGRGGEANLWQRFTRYDRTHPGRAECGNVHFAPNSERDYDWGNRRPVMSRCDDWLYFPDFQERWRRVNCTEWGNGDIRAHHIWWLDHLPRTAGETGGVANNWWRYVIDPNQVKGETS